MSRQAEICGPHGYAEKYTSSMELHTQRHQVRDMYLPVIELWVLVNRVITAHPIGPWVLAFATPG